VDTSVRTPSTVTGLSCFALRASTVYATSRSTTSSGVPENDTVSGVRPAAGVITFATTLTGPGMIRAVPLPCSSSCTIVNPPPVAGCISVMFATQTVPYASGSPRRFSTVSARSWRGASR
jgi:hypothetical protein